jgi:hypothetical protein
LPIVLEAELPLTEMAGRRVQYYLRNGFGMWSDEYRQPPYRAGDDYVPMCLMVYGNAQRNNPTREEAVRTIYKEVYGVDATGKPSGAYHHM